MRKGNDNDDYLGCFVVVVFIVVIYVLKTTATLNSNHLAFDLATSY